MLAQCDELIKQLEALVKTYPCSNELRELLHAANRIKRTDFCANLPRLMIY